MEVQGLSLGGEEAVMEWRYLQPSGPAAAQGMAHSYRRCGFRNCMCGQPNRIYQYPPHGLRTSCWLWGCESLLIHDPR